MKKNFYLISKIQLFFFLTTLVSTLFAQNTFEGTIKFTKETLSDTVNYTYYVKKSLIRVEEYDKNNRLINYRIIDNSLNSILTLDPNNKWYKYLKSNPYSKDTDEKFEIVKTENYQSINGYKCYQWLVKCRETNTVVAFWVTNDNFMFFPDYLKTENKPEKVSKYFLQIPDIYGYMPLLTEERSILREFRVRTKVVSIQKCALSDNLFTVPKDYSQKN